MRRNRTALHIEKMPFNKQKQRIYEELPDQVYESKYGKMLFYEVDVLMALRKLKMLPQIPWISGGGQTDKVTAITEHDANRLQELGVNKDKVVVTGQCSMDVLYDALHDKVILRRLLEKQYGLKPDKKLLIFAIPHMVEHKIISEEEQLSALKTVFSILADRDDLNTLLSLHPLAKTGYYELLAEEFCIPIVDEQLNEILPVGDVFLASYSSTVQWAAKIGIPTFVLDYGLNYTYLDEIKGLKIVQEFSELQGLLQSVLEDSEYYRLYSEKLVSSFKGYDVLDGKACHRVINVIKENTAKSSIKNISKVDSVSV